MTEIERSRTVKVARYILRSLILPSCSPQSIPLLLRRLLNYARIYLFVVEVILFPYSHLTENALATNKRVLLSCAKILAPINK